MKPIARRLMAAPQRRRFDPPRSLGALLIRFWHDERASYALEFGLCAIPFFGLIFSMTEASYVYYFTDALQQAVAQAARAAETGQAQADYGGIAATPTSFAQNFICSNAGFASKTGTDLYFPPNLNCANLIIDLRPVASFSAAGSSLTTPVYLQSPLDYCLGKPSSIIVMRVAYPLPAILPLAIFTSGGLVSYKGTNSHMILATQAFQTEPYINSSYTGC